MIDEDAPSFVHGAARPPSRCSAHGLRAALAPAGSPWKDCFPSGSGERRGGRAGGARDFDLISELRSHCVQRNFTHYYTYIWREHFSLPAPSNCLLATQIVLYLRLCGFCFGINVFAAMQISFWYFLRSRLIILKPVLENVFSFKHISFADKKVACIFFSGGGWWVPGEKQLATPTISAAAADTPSIISFHPSSFAMVRRGKQCKVRCPALSHSLLETSKSVPMALLLGGLLAFFRAAPPLPPSLLET